MANKLTAKRKAALEAAKVAGINPAKLDSEALYEALEAEGYFWYPKAGAFKAEAKQTSEFELPDGTPTGVFKIRLMAHPAKLPALVKRLEIAISEYGIGQITEVSEKTYPNRAGAGERQYLSGKMGGGE